MSEDEKKGFDLKKVFRGEVLDGFVEAARVRPLEEFTEEERRKVEEKRRELRERAKQLRERMERE